MPGIGWLVGLLVLVPGVMSFWRGRTLAKLADDPTLPERLAAAQSRSSLTFGVCLAIVLVAAPYSSVWAAPLMILGWYTGGYPLRIRLFEDTWSLGAYLSFCGRSIIAFWGFWFMFLAMPIVAAAARPFEWLAGAALAIGLVLWNARHADLSRWIMGMRPVTDPALLERFTAIAKASSAQMPRFEMVPTNGGVIANAFAMPSLRRPSVIFTETLLTKLDRDEIVAICAHEIAHLEHYNPRYLRHIDRVNHALIAAGLILTLVPRLLKWDSALAAYVIWVVLIVIASAWRVRDRQKNETASDLRAIALCGDAGALARGLTKVYLLARIPRRMDGEAERHATHPSLARRIQDIRSAAGAPPAALGETATFAAASGPASVTFLQDRLQWKESDLATHTLGYGYLSELRLRTTTHGPVLVAIERGGRRWELALAAADVARLQAVLDVIDVQLGPLAPAQSVWPNLGRMVVAMSTLMAGTLGQIAMAVVALIALLMPSAPVLAGAGVAALTTAFVTLWAPPFEMLDIGSTLALLFGLIGAVLLAAAWARRNEPVPGRTMAAIAALAVCAALTTAMFLSGGLHPVALHQSARQTPSAAVFLLATSAALACWRRRIARAGAIAGGLVGLLVAAAGTDVFLDRFGDDPLLGPSAPIARKTIDGPATSEASLPFAATGIRISPAGGSLALTGSVHEEDDRSPDHFVGRPGGTFTKVEAHDVVFIDDDRALGVVSAKGATEVFAIHVDDPHTIVWSTRLPRIRAPVLSYRAATGRWRVLGWNDAREIVRVEGAPGSPAVEETRWMGAKGSAHWPQAVAAAGAVAVFVETSYDSPLMQHPDFWRWALIFQNMRTESRFTRVTANAQTPVGVTRFGAQCVGAARNDDRLVCAGFDGTRTRFATVDPAAGRLHPVAWLPGRFAATDNGADGWVSGWWNSRPVAIRLESREALEMSPARDYVSHIAANDHLVATLTYGGYGAKLKTYSRQ